MKSHFFEYYQLSEDEIKKLWSESAFVFDANVLLDLYRYTPETSNDLIEIFKKLKGSDQLWIPHQVGYEFHKHRRETIYKEQNAYDKAISIFDDGLNGYISKSLVTHECALHPFIRGDEYKKQLLKSAKRICKELDRLKEQHPKLDENDVILNNVTECFENRVGDPYPKEELNKLYEKAQKRYDDNIPPGYLDAKKPSPEKYGDFVVWKQIIDMAKAKNKPVIFVTRDQKEDWWSQLHGNKIGARHELSREIFDEAGVKFYMYETINFIRQAKQTLQLTLNDKTISEIEKIKESDKKMDDSIVSSQTVDSNVITKGLTYVVKGDTGIASGTPSLSNAGEIPLPDITTSK